MDIMPNACASAVEDVSMAIQKQQGAEQQGPVLRLEPCQQTHCGINGMDERDACPFPFLNSHQVDFGHDPRSRVYLRDCEAPHMQ